VGDQRGKANGLLIPRKTEISKSQRSFDQESKSPTGRVKSDGGGKVSGTFEGNGKRVNLAEKRYD